VGRFRESHPIPANGVGTEIAKRAAIAAGGSEDEAEAQAQKFAGQSLRAGFATSAAAANVTGERMAKHKGWKSAQMATRYVREAELFKNNPLKVIFGG
jgi:hypothetical protein